MARHFDNWLTAYSEYCAHTEAPVAYHFWTGVSTIAGALRRRVWIEQYSFQWTPNFYIILVGPAGVVTKSTTINLGYSLLRKVEGVKFGPESMTWQALNKAFADAQEYVDYIDPQGQKQSVVQSALNIPISELGTFLRPEDSSLMSFLTRMWDGQKEMFQHSTLTSLSTTVENPWINVLGATTPAWLRANFPVNLIGEGFTSRVIFVYGERKSQYIAYPSRHWKPESFSTLQRQLIEDLTDISRLAGEYTISPAAMDWGEDWYRRLQEERPAHMASERYGGYIARKQTHLHKLGIVLSAARGNKMVVEEEDLKLADQILTGVETDMIKVFESIGVVDESRNLHEIISIVRTHKFITTKQLWAHCVNLMNYQNFYQAVRAGCEAGLLVVTMHNGEKGLTVPAPSAQTPGSSPGRAS
jgi:hypothetical protein